MFLETNDTQMICYEQTKKCNKNIDIIIGKSTNKGRYQNLLFISFDEISY